MVLRAGHDWFYPYYRDRALCLALGVTPLRYAAAGRGRRGRSRPPAAARCPRTGAARRSTSSARPPPPARSFCRRSAAPEAGRYRESDDAEVTLVCCRRWRHQRRRVLGSAQHRLPQAPAGALPDRGQRLRHLRPHRMPDRRRATFPPWSPAFPASSAQEVDGTDFLASYRALAAAAAYCRAGRGPALVHAHVIRPYSHSLSDDERLYKTPAERAAEAERDPVLTLSQIPDRRGRPRPPHAAAHHPRNRPGSARRHPAGPARRAAGARFRAAAPLFRNRRSHFRRVRKPSRSSAASP